METTISNAKKKKPLIVGINGIAGAGKDTIASMVTLSLMNDHRLKVGTFAFADNLKKAAAAVFGVPLEDFYDRTKKEIEVYGWGISPRQMAQLMGTEACRNGIRDDIWIKSLHTTIANSDVDVAFITDVRFDNEGEYVKGISFETQGDMLVRHNRNPGVVVNILRVGQELIQHSQHASEKGIAAKLIDHTITNIDGNPFVAASVLQGIILDNLKERE